MIDIEKTKSVANVEEFVKLVDKNRFHVQFTKTDGSVRDMDALLFESQSPIEMVDLSLVDITKDYVRVYDLENEGWRTIKISSILELSFLKQ